MKQTYNFGETSASFTNQPYIKWYALFSVYTVNPKKSNINISLFLDHFWDIYAASTSCRLSLACEKIKRPNLNICIAKKTVKFERQIQT